MTGYQSFIETSASQASSTSPHAVPALLPGVGGAVSGISIA
jgi:hypothetical protein